MGTLGIPRKVSIGQFLLIVMSTFWQSSEQLQLCLGCVGGSLCWKWSCDLSHSVTVIASSSQKVFVLLLSFTEVIQCDSYSVPWLMNCSNCSWPVTTPHGDLEQLVPLPWEIPSCPLWSVPLWLAPSAPSASGIQIRDHTASSSFTCKKNMAFILPVLSLCQSQLPFAGIRHQYVLTFWVMVLYIKFTNVAKMTLNSSSLHLGISEITSMYNHVSFIQWWGWDLGLHLCKASTLPAELYS